MTFAREFAHWLLRTFPAHEPEPRDRMFYRAHAATDACDGIIRSSPGSCLCGSHALHSAAKR